MNARILVVDDEPDIRVLLKDILEDEGYVVDVAEHARAANEIRRVAEEFRLDHSDFIAARSAYRDYLAVLRNKNAGSE